MELLLIILCLLVRRDLLTLFRQMILLSRLCLRRTLGRIENLSSTLQGGPSRVDLTVPFDRCIRF